MSHTPTVREGIVVALFLVVQFFWLFAAFAYSDTERVSDRSVGRGESARAEMSPSESAGAGAAFPELPALTPAVPAVPEIGSSFDAAIPAPPNPPRDSARAINAIFGTTTDPGALKDLGSYIKYCLVFPFFNAAGPPMPFFDVPPCPSGTIPMPAPTLTVVKVVINDDAGFATTTDFTLFVGSTTVSSSVARVFAPGSYIVSEATTTVTIGTTTMQYTQEFDNDCGSSGRVTLAPGDVKTCTIINDDPGPGGQGGDGGNGGNGGSSGGGTSGGGSSSGSGSSSSSGGSGGSPGSPSGQVLGATEPDFTGGADGEPGAPNAGAGGLASENIGLLLFSFVSSMLGAFYLRVVVKSV